MITLAIPDMSCGHCKAAVEKALTATPGVNAVSVDLPGKSASVDGPAQEAALLAALEQAGYPATVALR